MESNDINIKCSLIFLRTDNIYFVRTCGCQLSLYFRVHRRILNNKRCIYIIGILRKNYTLLLLMMKNYKYVRIHFVKLSPLEVEQNKSANISIRSVYTNLFEI